VGAVFDCFSYLDSSVWRPKGFNAPAITQVMEKCLYGLCSAILQLKRPVESLPSVSIIIIL